MALALALAFVCYFMALALALALALADFADFCFKSYGDRVKQWTTFNEPRVVAALGYDNGFFSPGRCSKAYGNCTAGNSEIEPYIVAHHLILSHEAAAQRYREKDKVRALSGLRSIQSWPAIPEDARLAAKLLYNVRQ